MGNRRVVVTGVGPVSAIGTGKEAFFEGLTHADSGIGPLTAFDTGNYPSHLAAEIEDFDVEDYLESQKTYLDRASELALAAVSLALKDSGLDLEGLDRSEIGLLLGSAYGSLETMALFFEDFLEKGPRLVKPFLFPHTYANTAISLAAIEYSLGGFHLNFSSGAVSASVALLEGYDRVRQGRSVLALAGGYEALNEVLFAGLNLRGSLSPVDRAAEKCAPFDRDRNGFILGEGSGVLVLEDLEHALARKARVYGEITGAGLRSDSTVNRDDPGSGAGIRETMQEAVRHLPPEDQTLDYVSANANGSVLLDRNEADNISQFLSGQDGAPLVSSTKSLTGETLGASGALQMIAVLAAIETGFIPPSANLRKPDEGSGLNLILNAGLEKDVRRALMNTIDPGGSMVSFVVEKAESVGKGRDAGTR